MMNDFLSSFWGILKLFFSTPYITNIFMIVLAGLGLIYIIKNLIFIGRSSF